MQLPMVYQHIHDPVFEQGWYFQKEDSSFTYQALLSWLLRYTKNRMHDFQLINMCLWLIGPSKSYEHAIDYFRKRFELLNRNAKKQIYVHYTVATDTQLLGHVMNSVSDSILHENVQTLLL